MAVDTEEVPMYDGRGFPIILSMNSRHHALTLPHTFRDSHTQTRWTYVHQTWRVSDLSRQV